jgi:MFS family permease
VLWRGCRESPHGACQAKKPVYFLSSPEFKKKNAEAPSDSVIRPRWIGPIWRPLDALLRLRALEALRYREFRLLWYGQVFTSMATWMDSIARGWLIYDLTNSSFQLGLVRGVQAIPTLLLSPIAGSAADRYSRKTQMLIAQVVDGLLYAWVAVMIITGDIQPWHVYLTSLGLATVQAFQLPSRTSMVSDSVPAGCLTNAMGLNAVVFNSARSAGPALAGLLIAFYGTAGSYSVQALFYLLATVWTVMLRPEQRHSSIADESRSGHGESFARSILEGWKFSWRNYEVRVGLLVVSFAMFLLIPFTTLLPVFARDILQVGARGQGILLTCMGIGALFSSVLVAFLGDRMPRGLFMIGGVALYGVLLVIFSASSSFVLSMALMFMIGLCHVTSHALIQIVIQSYSPSEFRGRTMAIFHMTQVILVIGAMFIGSLASFIGARWATTSMSIVGTLAMIAIYVLMPRARTIQ